MGGKRNIDAIVARLGTEISDDVPLRLDVAARIAFPDGSVGPSGLRSEAARGRLVLVRIANKDMTTLGNIKRMVEACHVEPSRPASGYDQRPATENRSGQSSTDPVASALAAAQLRIARLKKQTNGG